MDISIEIAVLSTFYSSKKPQICCSTFFLNQPWRPIKENPVAIFVTKSLKFPKWPNDPSAAPIATIDSNEEQNNDKDHITPSQLDALSSSQKNPDDHSSVTNVTKDLDEN